VADGALEAEIHSIVAENIWLIRDDLSYWFSNPPIRDEATQQARTGV
jgi:hypothetical protein